MRKTILTLGLTCNKVGNFAPIDREIAVGTIKTIMEVEGIPAYTLVDCTGYWEGKPEKSLQIIVINDEFPVQKVCTILKSNLLQDCIAVEISYPEFSLL